MVKFNRFILVLSLLVCAGILLLAYFIYIITFSHVIWSKTIEGVGGGYSVQQTDDEGYIIAAVTDLVKTDSNGDLQWHKTLSNPVYTVDLTSDGGYIVAGNPMYLAKTDSNGNIQWQKTYDEADLWSVQPTFSGGYIITAEIFSFANDSDVYIVKTDVNGEQEWNVTFGGTESDYGYYGIETVDGGYIITGETLSFGTNGYSDIFLIKIDNNGVIQWNKTYGGTSYDSALCVQQTDDGGFIITGSIDPYNKKSYVRLIKTDDNGTLQWDKYYAGTRDAMGNYVQQTTDGGYLIVGIDGTPNDRQELFLIKTDNMGNQKWTERLSGKGLAGGNSIEPTEDGNYLVVGYTALKPNTAESNLYLVKIAANA